MSTPLDTVHFKGNHTNFWVDEERHPHPLLFRSLLEEMHLDAFALCYQRGWDRPLNPRAGQKHGKLIKPREEKLRFNDLMHVLSYTMIILNDIWCTMCIYFLIHMINHQFCHIFVELGYPGDICRGKCWVVSVTVTGGTNTPGWLKHFGCSTNLQLLWFDVFSVSSIYLLHTRHGGFEI